MLEYAVSVKKKVYHFCLTNMEWLVLACCFCLLADIMTHLSSRVESNIKYGDFVCGEYTLYMYMRCHHFRCVYRVYTVIV